MDTKKFVLLDIDYITRNHKPVIRLFGKLSHGRSIIAHDKSFKPYIYILPYDVDDCINELSELELLKIEKATKKDLGISKEFLKITLKHPQDIPKLKNKILDLPSVKDIREHDIPFYRRYLIDKGLFPMNTVEVQGKILNSNQYPLKNNICIFQLENPPKNLKSSSSELNILSFKIETCNPRIMPKLSKDPIIMIIFSSNQGFQKIFSTKNSRLEFVELVPNETGLLKKFVETIKSENPDLVIGYNSDGFDFPYLRARASKLRVPLILGLDGSPLKFMKKGRRNAAVIKGRIHIDILRNILRNIQLDTYTLDRVYKEYFGENKTDIPINKIHECWNEGGEKLEQLFKYSMEDALAITKIAEKILPLSMEVTQIVGQPLFDVARMYSSNQIEWFLIRKAFEYGEMVPNKRLHKYSMVEGGYVMEPLNGLYENIVYFDFKSLYPSIIVSKNISPDSLMDDSSDVDCYIAPEFNHQFRKKPEGFIPSIIKKLLNERMRIKSLIKHTDNKRELQLLNVQQDAIKRLSNTVYGLFNHGYFRWYSIECSQAITSWGRDYIKKTMENAENQDFKIIYADTDGFYATYTGSSKMNIY